MEFSDVVQTRRSVKKYDPSFSLDDATLRRLFERVVLTPSSFNIQHWRFVVVREAAEKKALRAAAFDQAQVEEASATIVVCAKLSAFRDADRIYAEAPESVRATMLPMIEGFYAGNQALQRDEAIRSASLAAMTLMLAACDLGLATGPMIGFDQEAVAKLVRLDADHVPVMLIVIGKQVGDLRQRAYRHPLDGVVRFSTLDGPRLR